MDKKKEEGEKEKGYTKFSIFSARKKQVDKYMDEMESGRPARASYKKKDK